MPSFKALAVLFSDLQNSGYVKQHNVALPLHFTVLNLRNLLQSRVVWGHTFSLYIKHFSSSANNVYSIRTLRETKTGIFLGYLKARGPNVSCAIICLLKMLPWQSTSKLDGVSPIDNRPSTGYLRHFVQQKKITPDT